MKQDKKLRQQYIQLVETFITALERGKPGTELEDIRNEIRVLSSQLNLTPPGENHARKTHFGSLDRPVDEKNNGLDTAIS